MRRVMCWNSDELDLMVLVMMLEDGWEIVDVHHMNGCVTVVLEKGRKE